MSGAQHSNEGAWGYHGWRVVGVAFLCQFVAVGFFFYSFGVFFKDLAADLGGSRLEVSLGMTSVGVVSALLAPHVGRIVERGHAHAVILVGATSCALGFALLSMVRSLLTFYIVLAVFLGVGGVMLGQIPPAALVTGWFRRRLGTALGVATMGISLSGLAMPPIATWLISAVGWRGALRAYAVATLLLMVPPVLWLWRNAASSPLDAEPRDERRGSLLRDATFWLLASMFGLMIFALSAVLTHLVPMLTDRGLDPLRAASLLSVAAGAAMVGKYVAGVIADRSNARRAAATSLALQLVGLGLVMRVDGFVPLLLSVIVFGVGMGGTVPLQSILISDHFGAQRYPSVAGLMRPFMLPLTAAGVPLAGVLFDVTGSYRIALAVFAIAYVLAGACLVFLRPSR